MTLSPLRSTLTRLSSPYARRTNPGNSLDPYARQVMEEEKAGQRKFQPLQFVLDLLQRGQYLTANVADEVEESFRTGRPLGDSTLQVLKAAWEGLRGTRKGDWETLLFGGKIEGSSPEAGERPGWIPGEWGDDPLIKWGGEGTSGLGEGILRPRKLIGLAANIALDPTTYISFGATKAAQQAATKYADDVVRLTLAVDPEKIIGKLPIGLAKNPDEILKFIKAGKNTKAEKVINEIYQNAFKSALRNPVGKVMEDIQPTIQKAWGKEGLEDLVSRMVPESYEKMGERAGKFFGKEVGKGIRYPGPVRQWDLLKSKFEQSKVGNKLGDAWWSVMNNGPVGSIRKALGFRNPYQQMLHIAERQAERGVHGMIDVEAKKLAQVFGKFDDDIVNKHRLLRMEASDKGQPLAEMIRQYVDPNLMGPDVGKLGVKPEDVEKIIDLDRQVSQITHQWFMDEQTATVANGLPWDTTERVSYFPQQVGRGEVAGGTLGRGGASGTGSSGFKQSKKLSIADHVDNNAEMMKWLMGDQLRAAYDALPPQEKAIQTFDDWVRKWIIDKNLSETPLDLEQALTLRAIDHSKYMGKMRMVSDFRQFGIPIDEAVKAAPQLESQLVTYGTGTSKLGLYKVNLPGFENMVFDGDVADVITKAAQVVSSDDSIRQFASMFGRATSWWKGMVTMSPGFHWRNAISNNITGFLMYGPRWFTDSKKIQQSVVGTAYLLHPEKYQDLLSGAFKGETPEKFLNILRSPVGDGGLTLEEVIDSMRGMGSASARQVQEEIGKKAGTTLNPFSNKFKGFDVSRKIGDMVEGQAKVLAFLHEYSDVAAKGASVGGSVAEKLAAQKQYLQYADRQMNKWFIDYGDLCFDTKTEILTDAGWQTIDSIDYTQRALTFNLETDSLEWKPITYIYRAGYNGEMYYAHNEGFDACVTPKHKWVKIGGEQGGHVSIRKPKYSLVESNVVFSRDTRLKVTCDSFPGVEPIFSDDFVRLCGWVIAEGTYVTRGESIQVYQSLSHNPEHCEELKTLADRMSYLGTIKILPARATAKKDIMVLYVGKGIAEHIRDWLPNKHLTMNFLKRLSRNQLEILYEVLIDGDGTVNKKGSEVFTQKDEETTRNIQILAMMIGRRSVARKSFGIWKTGIYQKEKSIYVDALEISVIRYAGRIWCIHTDNRTVIARRNGTVYISGNTEFEQKVLKKVIPFYSWIRHNLANQISGLTLYPNMYSLIPKVRGAIKDDEDFDYSLMPDYMKNLGYYPVGKSGSGETIMRWANIPLEDINKIPILFEGNRPIPNLSLKEFATDIVANAHPIIKSAIELASGKDLFRQRDIRGMERAPQLFQYLNNSPRVVEFLDGMLRKAGFREGLRITPVKGGTELQMNGIAARMLENNMPVLKAIDMMIQTPETLAEAVSPNVETWIQKVSGKKDYYQGLNEIFQLVSQMFGWKFKGIVEEEELARKQAQMLAKAEELKREAGRGLPGYQKRREKTLAARQKRASRIFQ